MPADTSTVLPPSDTKKLLEIAKTHLGVATLETRQRDALDFYDVNVSSLKAALTAAYEAGYRAHQKEEVPY